MKRQRAPFTLLEVGHWKSIPADPQTRRSLSKVDLAPLCIHVKPSLSDDQEYLPGEFRLGLWGSSCGEAQLHQWQPSWADDSRTGKLEIPRLPQVCFVGGSLNSTSAMFCTLLFVCGTAPKEQHFFVSLGTAEERPGRMWQHHPGFSCLPGRLLVGTQQVFWPQCRGPVPSGHPKFSSSKEQLAISVLIHS